jgi:4-amino-4-deoxy-L-arabinose transferase-like glycosyltransferase
MIPKHASASEVAWLARLTLAYIGIALALRLGFGLALENDEGALLLHYPRGYLLGYGPQLPLYNWLQFGLFDVFGANLTTLFLMRASLLAGTVLAAYLALRQIVTPQVAGLAATSLALMPDVSWEAQRTLTHTPLAVMLSMATLAIFIWMWRTRRLGAFLALGIVIGLGGLSKPNYWLVPPMLAIAAASMAEFRGVFRERRLLLVPLIAGTILLAPYGWILGNLDLALASSRKLMASDDVAHRARALMGLSNLVESTVSSLLLLVFVALVFWSASARQQPSIPPEARVLIRFLLRAFFAGALLFAAAIVLVGIGNVAGRWLMVLTPFAALAISAAVLSRLPAKPRVIWAGLCAVIVLGFLIALAVLRTMPPSRGATDPEELAALLDARFGAAKRIILADHYLGGNLRFVRPEWDVRPSHIVAPLDRAALLVSEGDRAISASTLARFGIVGWTTSPPQTLEAPYQRPTDRRRRFYVSTMDPPG